jgi:hypothetical protein
MFNFQEELDALITRAKMAGCDLGEMHADLIGAAEGLSDEIDNADVD